MTNILDAVGLDGYRIAFKHEQSLTKGTQCCEINVSYFVFKVAEK